MTGFKCLVHVVNNINLLIIDRIIKFLILIFSTDPTKPGDLKESFDIGAFDDKKFVSKLFL